MSAWESLGGEDKPQRAKLPAGYFDALSAAIWHIGQKAHGPVIEAVLPPAEVILQAVYAGNLALELGFEFRKNPVTDAAEPVSYRALMAETEPYTPIEGAHIWTWREFSLNTRRRTKQYTRGTSIVMSDGSEMRLTDEPDIGKRRVVGKSHRGLQQLDVQCTVDDYLWFMDKLRSMSLHLQENE